jgi:hypothetical protein
MNWYFVCDIMMDNWEKWWPVFLFQDNSSYTWKERTKKVSCRIELENQLAIQGKNN